MQHATAQRFVALVLQNWITPVLNLMLTNNSTKCFSWEPMFLEKLIRSAITGSSPKVSHTRDSDGPFMVNFEHTGKLGGIHWKYPQVRCGGQSNFGWYKLISRGSYTALNTTSTKIRSACSRYERNGCLFLRSITKLCSLHRSELRAKLLKLFIRMHKPHWNFSGILLRPSTSLPPNCTIASTDKVSALVKFFFLSVKQNLSQTLDLNHLNSSANTHASIVRH